MSSNVVLILLDGLGDRAYEKLGNLTPLQAAATPNLDRLAALGSNGLFYAQRPGLALPSENAHFAMFGYSADEFPGRGTLEALGADIPLNRGDVAVLAHFVNVFERAGVLHLGKDRPEAKGAEADELSRLIGSYHTGQGVTARYTRTKDLDGIITLQGDLSAAITDTDPLAEGEGGPMLEIMPHAPWADERKALITAAALKEYLLWCYSVLAEHPLNKARTGRGEPALNFFATQRAGQWHAVEPFSRRWGIRGLSIASGIVYWGLSRFLGLECEKVKDSDNPGADLAERIGIALKRRREYPFIHVHTKAPDAAAHSKDPENKVRAIASLDKGVGEVLSHLDGETVFVITADHSTPSTGPLVHSGEAVPFLMVGPGMRRDPVKVFDEVHGGGGCLGTLRGRDFMPLVLNALDRTKLQGLMDCPENLHYWPGRRTPFRLT